MSAAAAKLVITGMALGPIGTNCYIVQRDDDSRAVIIDPGADAARVLEHVREADLEVECVLVTHTHYDHIGAVAEVAQELGVPVFVSEIEALVLRDPEQFYAGMEIAPHDPEHTLEGGERLELAGIEFDVLHLPGHSPGTMGFFVPGHRDGDGGWAQPPVLFIGDVVFEGSIGRFDLPFADGPTLFNTIRELFDHLDDATILLSGHGPATTVARERRTNPFVLELVGAAQ